MSQFVLVHGGFHGSVCWRKAVAEVKKRDCEAKAMDLSGQGGEHTPLKRITLDSTVERVLDEMHRLPGPVVLVGHSGRGIPISVTGEPAPDRVKYAGLYKRLSILPDGEASLDIENRNPKPVVP